jgi:LEA14-like dessication related protein
MLITLTKIDMRHRRGVFMHMLHTYKVYTAISMALLLLVTGCSAAPTGWARQLNLETPQVNGVSYSLVSASPDSFTADLELNVYNPNAMTIVLSSLYCKVFVNGIKAADITQTEPAVLAARQDSTVKFRAELAGSQMGPCLAGHISRGESSRLLMSGTAYIGFGWLSFPYPFTYERDLKTDLLNYKKLGGEKPLPLPGLSVTRLSSRWGAVGPDSLQVIHEVSVVNRSRETITLSTAGYEVRGNGIELAEGTVGNGGASIGPGVTTVGVINTIRTENISAWLASHLNRGEVPSLELNFKPGSSVGTSKDTKSLDGRTFKAEIQTNLANELAQLRNSQ